MNKILVLVMVLLAATFVMSGASAADPTGTPFAAGSNGVGQLGDGTSIGKSVPVAVNNITNAIAVAAGSSHGLALKDDGTVWAWGSGSQGQLGNGLLDNQPPPVQVTNLTGIKAISAGFPHGPRT